MNDTFAMEFNHIAPIILKKRIPFNKERKFSSATPFSVYLREEFNNAIEQTEN